MEQPCCWHDVGAWQRLEGAWERLHERSATATLFNSFPYAALWWQHFGTPGALHLWSVWEGDELLGLAPLYETGGAQGQPLRRLIGGVDVSDYLDLLLAPGREEEVLEQFLAAWADAPCRCPLDLHCIRHASPTREALLLRAAEHGFTVRAAREAVCPVIPLPDSWEGYLARLDGKQRRELRRKLRRAGQEALVSWYRAPGAALEEEMTRFFELHARSSPDKAAFMTPTMRAFFLDLAHTFSQRGWLDLRFLLLDGQPAASYLTFLFRDEVLVYNSGYDSERAGELSPGWLLLCYHIEAAIAQGRSRYDFLRGDEPYKFRFGAQAEAIYQIQLTLP